MRVAFVIPDRVNPWDSIHQGIGYLAAYARKHVPGVECAVFRTAGTQERELDEFLAAGWDVVGLTLTGIAVAEGADVTKAVRRAGKAAIVAGGAEVTSVGEGIFAKLPELDYAVCGEGEVAFAELLRALKGQGDLAAIRGLVWRDGDGRIRTNPPRPFDTDLEEFPFPDRTLFRYDYPYHAIIGTRGCPFRCTFCNSSANWGHSYRLRKPETVAEEVEEIIRLYGRDRLVAFGDDSFNLDRRWVLEVCDLLRGLGVRWWIRGLRASVLTEDVAARIAGSGCIGAACGVESANNEALKAMRKGTTIEEILRGVDLLQSKGIPVLGQFIIGNQADTLDTVRESIACARRFHDATFGIAYPIEHTELHDFVVRNGYMLEEKVPILHKGRIVDSILFDTPGFPVEERLAAVKLAIRAGFYHGVAPGRLQALRRSVRQKGGVKAVLRQSLDGLRERVPSLFRG